MVNKEVFVYKESVQAIAAGAIKVIDIQEQALKSAYLPFNKLRGFNKSDEELWIFLDNYGDGSKPDYIVPKGTGFDESILEGVQFNQVIIQNKDAVNATSNDEIKIRIATVREEL
jgi:hypothetical protein